MTRSHRRVLIGVEIEAYSITEPAHRIGLAVSRPRSGLSEQGERFGRDPTVGSEYNSRPLSTVREALFLLKAGLRKYLRDLYRSRRRRREQRVPLLVGTWTNRVAAAHLHISVTDKPLSLRTASSLAFALHDHLPLLVAVGANSPVWDRQITSNASNRLLHAGDTYFAPLRRGQLAVDTTMEMCFVPERKKTKPATLEIRVLDANIPEYIVASMCFVKAICLRWLRRKPASNRIAHEDYLRARHAAAVDGVAAELCWAGQWLPVPTYLDRFIEMHRPELEAMDIPDQIFRIMRLAKRGHSGASLIRKAARVAHQDAPESWEALFAERYARALEDLLSGNTLDDFADALRVRLPSTRDVWLGSEEASIDE